MSNIVDFAPFDLKKEISMSDFLLASDIFHGKLIYKQKSYISGILLSNGDIR